jgi:hypothetical protein
MRMFEEVVLANKEKVMYEKRIRLYKVNNDESFNEAIKETRSQNRIPVFIRTSKNNWTKEMTI